MLKYNIIESLIDIPEAERYVIATDTFMSGWGPAANKKNIVVCPCESIEEAERVYANLLDREEMRNIHINSSKPRLYSSNLYSLCGKDRCPRWYKSPDVS